MDMILNIPTLALNPLVEIAGKIGAFLPPLIAGMLLLIVGALAAHWLRYAVDQVLTAIKMDDIARRIGLSDIVNRLGLGPSPARLVGTVMHIAVILAFVLGAAEALGLPIVSEFLNRLTGFFPRLLSVVLVMGGGLYLGEIAGRIVHRCADANRVRGADALMRMTHGLVVIFAGVMALEILGFSLQIFYDSMQFIVGAVCLGFAIAFGVAFGMAGRDTAERMIRELTPKSKPGVDEHEPRMRVVR